MSTFTPAPQPAVHLPAPAVFLGALASEVNEPDDLGEAFAAIADLTERVVLAVRNGALPEEDGARALRALRLTDASGMQWAVGATSQRWYRKAPERGWKLAVPPPHSDASHQQSLDEALSALPGDLLALLGGGHQASGPEESQYGIDPLASNDLPVPAAWEYEHGDDRRHTF